jgi:hypothetical protein
VDDVDIVTCGGIVGIIIAVRVCSAGLENNLSTRNSSETLSHLKNQERSYILCHVCLLEEFRNRVCDTFKLLQGPSDPSVLEVGMILLRVL